MELGEELRRILSQENTSALFVTHDQHDALSLADRVAVMYLGRIVETGSTETIFASPQHPYTRALLAAAPFESAPTLALPRGS